MYLSVLNSMPRVISTKSVNLLCRYFHKYTTDVLANTGGLKLHCHYWQSKDSPKALVMMMHGYAEHLQWYHHVGVSLAQQGFLAFGHDHLGHGRSEGFRVAISDVNELVDDAFLHVSKMQKLYPNTPTYLIGHSMGGLVALLSVVRDPSKFQGVVFNGPFIMLGADVRSPIKKWCARTFCRILPNAQVGKLTMTDVTGDDEIIKKISSDPLWWQGGVRLITGAAFLNCVEKVSETFPSIELPFLVIHGENDKICDIEGSNILMKMASSKDKAIKTYPDGVHHLYLDKKNVREAAIKDTVEWITSRVKT